MVDELRAKEFGGEIKALRKKKCLGLRELAAKAGISKTYLSYIEEGRHGPPSAEKVMEIARVLEENPDRLLRIAGHIDPEVSAFLRRHQEAVSPMVRKIDPIKDPDLFTGVFLGLLFMYGFSLRETSKQEAGDGLLTVETIYQALKEASVGAGIEAQRNFAKILLETMTIWLQDLDVLESGQIPQDGS